MHFNPRRDRLQPGFTFDIKDNSDVFLDRTAIWPEG
jgi:hypothetical protein